MPLNCFAIWSRNPSQVFSLFYILIYRAHSYTTADLVPQAAFTLITLFTCKGKGSTAILSLQSSYWIVYFSCFFWNYKTSEGQVLSPPPQLLKQCCVLSLSFWTSTWMYLSKFPESQSSKIYLDVYSIFRSMSAVKRNFSGLPGRH